MPRSSIQPGEHPQGLRRGARSQSPVVTVLLALFLGGLVLAACERLDPGRELAERWIDALNSHDPKQVVQLLSPTAKYSDPSTPEPVKPTELAFRWEQGWKLWKDQVYQPRKIVSAGQSVAIEWHIEQTHPSGVPVPVNGVTVLDIQDGRIVAVRSYFDPSVYLRFLTVRP